MPYLFKKRAFCLAIMVVAAGLFMLWNKWQITPITGMPVAPDGYSWKLAFDDEFSGNSLNTTRWVTCYDIYHYGADGCTNAANNELEWYVPSSVKVANGSAFLTAKKQPTTGFSSGSLGSPGKLTQFAYESGMISTGTLQKGTAAKWSGSYGYYIVRAKLPAGKGLWPAFWLLPVNGQWPPEIDIMEMLGDNPHKILMTYFWPDGKYPPPKDSTIYTGANYSKGWHTYAINWQPGQINWYIDGVLRKKVQSPNVPSTPMQIIADLAVGGTLPGNPGYATIFPQSMQIDYIRVYLLHK